MKPIRGGLLSGVVAAILLLALPAATSWAAFPGANGLIAYSAPRGLLPGTGYYGPQSNWEIFTISPAGGDPTRLTDNAIPDTEPSWSANGRRLAFIRGSFKTGQNPNVWTMRADGTDQRQVTHGPAYESSPSFSPGGGRIVMARDRAADGQRRGWPTGSGNIVITRTDGTGRDRLTSGQVARNPMFAPGGRRIVFAGAPTRYRRGGIWVMRRDGTHKRLLANPAQDPDEDSSSGLYYLHPDFDPDGSHIVFERCVFSSHSCDTDNILMRSNGRRKRVIAGGEAPAFSPSGRLIAAVAVICDYVTEHCDSSLVSYARNGPGGRVVREDDIPAGPSWQPMPQP